MPFRSFRASLACLLIALGLALALASSPTGQVAFAGTRAMQPHPVTGTAATPVAVGSGSSLPATGGAAGYGASTPSAALDLTGLALVAGGVVLLRLRRR